MSKKIVIIGNSAAGISTAETLRKFDKDCTIAVFTDENYGCYSRCLLSYLLAGDIPEEKLIYRKEEFYAENKIELIRNKKIIRIDHKKKRIVAEDKTQFEYDFLVLANGASSKMPEIKGIQKNGVFGFRTIEDAKNILKLLPVSDTACIMGGGLIGLKAAYSLKKRGLEVKVVVKSPQVLSQMLDEKSAKFFKQRLTENGIDIITGSEVAEILGNGDVKAVRLDIGKVIACQIVIVGKGVSPNIKLVKDTEIKTKQGILTNEYMLTNIPEIYAAGDIAETFDVSINETSVNALWPVAVEQGKVVGSNISGQNLKYDGSIGMNSVEFFGLPVISLGITRSKEPLEELTRQDAKNQTYKKLLIRNNLLVGAILFGRINNSGVFLNLIREKIDISRIKDKLLNPGFAYPHTIELNQERDITYV
ncbi:MAG: FAD-dependent oxidoreductase [Candidatus Omnitrophota bacterium]|nr:FAD-dependent oxidoreductase [Candidatus Omnitrophota bacterium]